MSSAARRSTASTKPRRKIMMFSTTTSLLVLPLLAVTPVKAFSVSSTTTLLSHPAARWIQRRAPNPIIVRHGKRTAHFSTTENNSKEETMETETTSLNAEAGATTISSSNSNSSKGKVAAATSPASPLEPSVWRSFQNNLRGTTTRTTSSSSSGAADAFESRILYPDIDSGKVNRMFSTLEYTIQQQDDDNDGSSNSNNNNKLKASHATGSVGGAAALVAGTTVGAGVLALPAATVSTGFLPSTAALLVAYVFMTTAGLLIAELTLNQIGRTGRPGLGLLELYESSLGNVVGGTIGKGAYFFLHYAMMVAYIAQGGTNVQTMSGGIVPDNGASQALFASLVGASLLLSKPAWVEKFNNAMVLAVGTSFLGIVAIGAQTADWSALVNPANQHPEAVVSCFPILFLSLVYQNIVPTVVNNLEGDRSKITKAITLGTTAPLLMFLAWNAVCLGNAGSGMESGADPVALLQSGAAASSGEGGTTASLLAPLVTSFSVLALITSLIGFTYGLVDAWTDIFGINQKSEAFSRYRPALYALVYLPPLALSMTDPNIFYTALEYGGAFGVSTLFLVLPPLMVWKERYLDVDSPLITKPMVGLGKMPLGAMWLVAGSLILEQAAEKSGLLELIQTTS